MNLQVLIADDEYFIRQRIKKIIPWDSLNLSFADEADNGKQVLNILQNKEIDIIILDIKMPIINGIEVAQYVQSQYPLTKIIILSGYNDFEYARSALQYGVSDYLLKPIEKGDLIKSLKNCIQKLNQLKQQHISMEHYYHHEKCQRLSETINHTLSLQSLQNYYPELLTTKFTVFIGIFIYQESDFLINNLIEIIRAADINSEYLREGDYSYVIQSFLSSHEQELLLKELLQNFISLNSKYYIYIVFGSSCSLNSDWLTSYQNIILSINSRYFYENSTLILSTDFSCKSLPDVTQLRNHLLRQLNSKNIESFQKYLQNVFSSVKTYKNPKYLLLVVNEIFLTYSIYCQDILGSTLSIPELTSSIVEEEYRLENLLESVSSYGLQYIRKNSTVPSDVLLCNHIIQYIQKEYSNPDLSVTGLSETFHLNASYMGSIFKKVQNCSILQYITYVRLEASKPLLSSHRYKISDIAEMVGYNDVFYFSKRFKKHFGLTPKDYSQQNISV